MRVKREDRIDEIQAIWFDESGIHMIDQRLLPGSIEIYTAENVESAAYAIKEMVVRGAPAIGVTAAFALALYSRREPAGQLEKAAELLKSTRPTAVDLEFALNYMLKCHEQGLDLAVAAQKYCQRIVDKCRKIGEFGAPLIKNNMRVLTHCNAGALATVDWGTALAPMRVAARAGINFFVYVDETRPRLQGAKLTAWELENEDISYTIIADNAAGLLFSRGKIDLVITGADRIASNGDFANKIGTYEKAVLAARHKVPFYVAAPASSFDFGIESGDEIPIEERSETEVLYIDGVRIAPEQSTAYNPAFDITPSELVAGYITEFGLFRPQDLGELKNLIQIEKMTGDWL